MFIITRQQVAVIVFALITFVGLYLLYTPLKFWFLILFALALIVLLVMGPIGREHQERQFRLEQDRLSGERYITFTLTGTGLTAVTLQRKDLEALVVDVTRHRRWWKLQWYELATQGDSRLSVLVHGELAVLIFTPESGPGYRIIFPTAELAFLLA